MSELALQLIAENKKTQDPFLDLGNCGLKNYIPEQLGDCVWLNGLNLGNGYYPEGSEYSLINSSGSENYFKGKELFLLEKLTSLQILYLNNTEISDISFLSGIANLMELSLDNNEIRNISSLSSLLNLSKLHLSRNKIKDISILRKLTDLNSLYLSSNRITECGFIADLKKLNTLDLSFNYIKDICFLTSLSNLSNLYLTSNEIKDISCLDRLYKLTKLFLAHNQITDLKFLNSLTKLTVLDLSQNKIKDIHHLTSLTNLTELNLYGNQIINFDNMENLTQLKNLNLSTNEVTDIEFLIPILKRGLEINLENDHFFELNNEIGLNYNPITNPPYEIVRQGREAVIEYFEGQRKPLNECKLIFVGEGGVGKTSLMRRVVYDKFDKNEITTHGINKIAWEEIKTAKNERIKVNLWDFGGQHIQHSLHQFFFTKRVIYVLVLNPRNDLKANYWLDQIEKLGCDSEVLVVYNWKQPKDKQGEFMSNFYELRKKYPKLPEPFVLSCETGEGLEAFKKQLIECILKNDGLNDEYLVKWFKIKQKLEKEVSVGKNYINYEIYQKWCKEEKYNDPKRQKSLLEILNRVGSIVFFDKPKLEDWQVLNPEWITTGAYSILVSEQNKVNKGHISWQDLKEIFKEEKEVFSDKKIRIKYSENQFQFIIDLMLEYNLCQRNPFQQHEYLIPSAFGEKPDKNYDFAKENARVYRIQFDSPFEMLVIHRFIAKNLSKIIDKDYWQSGIYIKHPSSETYALVETNLYSKRIDCWIKGDNIRGFWEIIRADFREILSIYHNFHFSEEVEYYNDGKSYFLPYQQMLYSLNDGIKIIDYDKETRLKNIDVLAVLDLFEDKDETLKKMEKDRINIKIENNNSPHFEQKNENKNIINIKIDVNNLKEFDELKELLLDLDEYNIQNEEWKNTLIKALDEFHKLDEAEEKSSQKTSISIIGRAFKKLKDLKDIITIGLLPVDIDKKLPELFSLWETFTARFK